MTNHNLFLIEKGASLPIFDLNTQLEPKDLMKIAPII